jgi:hypothetical protein
MPVNRDNHHFEAAKSRAEAPLCSLRNNLEMKNAVLLFFNRRTKHYLTSLSILNNPKVAAAIKVWLEQSIKS